MSKKAFAPSAINIAVADAIVQSLDGLSLARENWVRIPANVTADSGDRDRWRCCAL